MSSVYSTSNKSTSSSLSIKNPSIAMNTSSLLPRNKSRNLLFPIAVNNSRTYSDTSNDIIIEEGTKQQQIKSSETKSISTMIDDSSNKKCKLDIIGNTNDILSIHGYKREIKLAPTLQGEVFIASSIYRDTLLFYGYIRESLICDNLSKLDEITNICIKYMQPNDDFVIKKANKSLHEQQSTFSDKTGKKLRVEEDIIKEAQIMKMFQKKKCPKQIIKYYDFFADNDAYYLVMERGGNGLFEFVVECHEHIVNGKLSIKEWRNTVRIIFAKMVKVIAWMHRVAHCCHLDVSLENVVMSRDTFFDQTDGKIKNLDIRFIDFGLTEIFDIKTNPKFYCNKFAGKTGYKAPKIYKSKQFMANKADLWSLGCALFMMSIGAPPFQIPSSRDPGFNLIKRGGKKQMLMLLRKWNRLQYIGKNQFDILMKMLCIDENKRIDIKSIIKHPWIRVYFKHCIVSKGKSKSLLNKNDNSPSIVTSVTSTVTTGEYCAAVQD